MVVRIPSGWLFRLSPFSPFLSLSLSGTLRISTWGPNSRIPHLLIIRTFFFLFLSLFLSLSLSHSLSHSHSLSLTTCLCFSHFFVSHLVISFSVLYLSSYVLFFLSLLFSFFTILSCSWPSITFPEIIFSHFVFFFLSHSDFLLPSSSTWILCFGFSIWG